MTTRRLAVLFVVLAAGLSTLFLLPKVTATQPVGIELSLPKMVGGTWYGRDEKVADREQGALGLDTQFARKRYTNARGDEIFASIVLAGSDMNTSIHRPEWCLPAQGWTIVGSSKRNIPLPGRGILGTTRLFNSRYIPDKEDGKPIRDANGDPIQIHNIDYYWFVGYEDSTPSHFNRNIIDITDRITKGYNQRWAFLMVAANVTKQFSKDGLDEAQTDAMIRDFITKLVPLTHKESVRFN